MKMQKLNSRKSDKLSFSISSFKDEYLRWAFVIVATIVLYTIVSLLVCKIYTPDIEALKAEAAKITFQVCNPEPMESLLYQLALFFIPVSILFFHWMSKKKWMEAFFRNFKFDSVIGILCVSGIAILAYYAFAAANPNHAEPANSHDIVAVTNFDFYFYKLFFYRYFFVYLLVIFPLFLAAFFAFSNMNKQIQKFFSIATWCILGLLLLLIIPINIFEFPYTWENKFDFNAVYYSTAQVYGGSPMLVDGLSSTHGLYAQLLNPIFQLTGLTPLSFSIVMAILLGLCFIFQTYFVHKFTNNKFLSLLACLSLVFFPYLVNRLLTPFESVFAMFPIRWLSFSTLLIIAVFYISEQKKIWYYTGNILLSFLVLWNPEIGVVSFITWLALLVYTNFYTSEKKIAYVNLVKLLVISLSVLVAVFVVYTVIIKLSYGVFPDITGMFKMIMVFGSLGFNMIPMSVPHPWMLFAIIYVAGFMYALTKLFDKTITPKSSAVFLLSIVGSGLFMYFVGRSHNWNLLPFSAPAFMLLAILGDDLWVATKTSRLFSYRIIFAVVVFVLAVASVEMLFNATDIWALRNDSQAKIQQAAEEESIKSNQQFIKANTTPHEKIFVLTSDGYQGLYFPPNKNRSAANPGFIELMLNTERDTYLDAIRDSSFKVFIEPHVFRIHLVDPIMLHVAAAYEFEKQNGSMFLLKKHAGRSACEGILENSNAIVHEIFSNDTKGFQKRVNYMQGYPAVQLGNIFTVELIFKPTPQPYKYAILLGNQKDDTGFSIFCVDQQAKYAIELAGTHIPFTVELNQVNYLAMSFIHERIVALYLNGDLVSNFFLNDSFKPSEMRLHIGNYSGYSHYYIGDVREVCITEAPLIEAEVQWKWDVINNKME